MKCPKCGHEFDAPTSQAAAAMGAAGTGKAKRRGNAAYYRAIQLKSAAARKRNKGEKSNRPGTAG